MKQFKTNYYFLLHLSPTASSEDITLAFRKLAQKYHPDKNSGNKLAEKKFKQINEAYQILKDPLKRKQFDDQLKAHSPPSSPPSSYKKADVLHKEVKDSPSEKALDLEVALNVSLEQVCQRQTCVLNYLKPENGKQKKTSFSIELPPGVRSGDFLRFKKRGGAQGSKLVGDLYVKVIFKEHPLFKWKGRDIHLDFPLRFTEALQGKKVRVPTPLTPVFVDIPSHTLKEEVLRLKNQGLPKSQEGERGDMFVRLIIDYPTGQKSQILKTLQKIDKKDWPRFFKGKENPNDRYSKVLHYENNLKKLFKESS